MTEANGKRSSGSGERVVLLHGLGRTRRSMRRLRIALRAAGYQPLSWGYHSRRHRIAEHVAHFRGRLEELAGAEEPVHFVGHSLGALIIRGALSEPSESAPFPLGRIVMIAPPNHGADVAERFGGTRLARWFYGEPVRDLEEGAPPLDWLGLPATEFGIIAGSRRFHPLNPISYVNALRDLEYEHDGTVEIENTRLPGMKDFLVVTAHHTFICNHPQVICQTITFLKSGVFARAATRFTR